MNLVDVSSAATAELVSRVIDGLGVKWTADMATAALIGIMTDTGSFQFPSTDSRALERAARLREAGADLQAITYNVFRNKRFQALKLWGFAFSKMHREEDGLLVWTEVTREDFRSAQALDEDISGLVEQIARANGMRVALPSRARRRRGEGLLPHVGVGAFGDASAVMARFGAADTRAAGALIKGDLEEIRESGCKQARSASRWREPDRAEGIA